MKLGLMLGYSGAEMSLPVELVQRAEAPPSALKSISGTSMSCRYSVVVRMCG